VCNSRSRKESISTLSSSNKVQPPPDSSQVRQGEASPRPWLKTSLMVPSLRHSKRRRERRSSTFGCARRRVGLCGGKGSSSPPSSRRNSARVLSRTTFDEARGLYKKFFSFMPFSSSDMIGKDAEI